MKPSLVLGDKAEIVITVTEDMCPAFDGVVVHRVYSTWAMGHHFEIAARKLLMANLEANEEGIGSHLSIDHIAPTPLGHQVRIVAEAVEIDRTTLACEIVAHHVRPDGSEKLVGQGKQVQRVLPKTTLRKLIEREE